GSCPRKVSETLKDSLMRCQYIVLASGKLWNCRPGSHELSTFAGLFCPPAVSIACLSRSYGRPHVRKWIPPDDFQGDALRSTLLFFVNEHLPLLASPFGIALRGRSLSLGFYFVHSRHE